MDATRTKPFNIDKKLVYDAYKAVKANAGAAGVDGQSLEMFDKDLMRNLYKIWNRMSSGILSARVADGAKARRRARANGIAAARASCRRGEI